VIPIWIWAPFKKATILMKIQWLTSPSEFTIWREFDDDVPSLPLNQELSDMILDGFFEWIDFPLHQLPSQLMRD
jgi:hypothetical protein